MCAIQHCRQSFFTFTGRGSDHVGCRAWALRHLEPLFGGLFGVCVCDAVLSGLGDVLGVCGVCGASVFVFGVARLLYEEIDGRKVQLKNKDKKNGSDVIVHRRR